ncbi:bactofilin family protein [Martelella soudanensis]|uniref:bactofilin family protein n=1 Tax=unclassified Martelella TaxID=2629616 RepID=UPI0015DF1865|nr:MULTISPECIES: polymer-forming cytoskeletal protein [unclassified Martelella]
MSGITRILATVFTVLVLACTAAMADDDKIMVFGGDTYASGTTTVLNQDSPRNAFVAGATARLDGSVGRDALLAGARVRSNASVNGDLYAAGFSVKIDGTVAGDLSAAGADIEIGPGAAVSGNARLAGGSVEINAPIAGSLLVGTGDLTLNAAVSGDVRIMGDDIAFGPDATVGGTLTYYAPDEVTIPTSVIAADKVTYHKLTPHAAVEQEDETEVVSDTTVVASFISMLVFMLALAAVFLLLAPQRTETARARLIARPFASLGYGFVALSTLIGAVPVALMTIIAIPLIPFVVLATVVGWTFAYLLAVYALSWWVVTSIRPLSPSLVNRLLAIAGGLVLMSLLHYLPFFGWIANIVVVLLGFGAMAALCGHSMLARRERRNAEVIETPPPQPPEAVTSDPVNPPDEPPRA